jgi:DNA-directed RNA polymerase specialized sigma24 family protein
VGFSRLAHGDPAAHVALVAQARRQVLLGIHRRRLQWEDLEDCYSQATLELIARARGGRAFSSSQHIANALEQRFLSRVLDRRRALSGRSPMQAALGGTLAADADITELVDGRPGVEELVMLRFELEAIERFARELTLDQRLVLASQVGLGMECGEFCRRFGWSAEKYRKVAQRARARLRRLNGAEEVDVPVATSCRTDSQRPAHE